MAAPTNKYTRLIVAIVVIGVIAGISVAVAANKNKTANYQLTPAKSTTSASSPSASTTNTTNSSTQTSSTQPQTTSSTSTTTTPTTQPATPTCFTASQAASEEGQSGCVQFTGYAYTSDSGQMYLDQYSSAPYGFSAWIPAGTSDGASLLSQYSGQSIDVTGYIQNYKGEPEIEVTSASQITLAQ